MASPQRSVRVRVDGQGRMVLPRGWRELVVRIPGDVLLQRTPDGLLLTPADAQGDVRLGDDGLPVLSLGRRVSNADLLDAIDAERAER